METPLANKLLKVRDLLVQASDSNAKPDVIKASVKEALAVLGATPSRVKKMEEVMGDAIQTLNAEMQNLEPLMVEEPLATMVLTPEDLEVPSVDVPSVDDVDVEWEEPQETTSEPKRRPFTKKKKF